MVLYQALALFFFLTTLICLGMFFACMRRKRKEPNSPIKAWSDKYFTIRPSQELKLLGHIIDNIWHGILVTNENREIISINKSMASLFYLSPEDVLGRKTINVFNNNHLEKFIGKVFESLEPRRENIIFYEDEELYMDMEAFLVTARGELLDKHKKGHAAGLKLVILAKNNTQEIEFSKLRSQFVANVSHEMRTPITSIRGYLEILEDELKEDEKKRHFVSKSLEETERLNYLIEDVLNLSKIEYKRNVLLKEEVEIIHAIREILDGLRYLARQNQIEIEFNYSDETINFVTDPDLFRQLVKNLAENSIFHAGRQSRLSISVGSTDEGIYLYFRDDGVGISKEDIPYIFQRFYRGKTPFSAKRIGSGLGLSIVKHIVDLHNGRIRVQSKPNIETVFKVFLPAKQV